MKIYFTASISQREELGNSYDDIVKTLKGEGYKVQADHIIKADPKALKSRNDKEVITYYKQFINWLKASDIVVAEVSYPSTIHIGHEISLAMDKGKPVVALYQEGKMPYFLQGLNPDLLHLVEYSPKNLKQNVIRGIEDAKDNMDVRFNFFVSPKIVSYLDWIAKKRRMPRAVYLRRLIEAEMRRDKDFLEQ